MRLPSFAAPLRRLGPAWRVQQQRHPAVAARIETAALVARGGLADEVRTLRIRVAELERDHRLLAAHVATLTEQAASAGSGGFSGPTGPEAEAARQRARLAAIAFYEERIGRLEQRSGRGRARPRPERASDSRTSGERRETA